MLELQVMFLLITFCILSESNKECRCSLPQANCSYTKISCTYMLRETNKNGKKCSDEVCFHFQELHPWRYDILGYSNQVLKRQFKNK